MINPYSYGYPTKKLAKLCELNIGRTPRRAESRYWGPGHPWLSIKDMNQGVRLEETAETITEAAVSECNCKPVAAGTVLMSFKLSIGKVGVAAREMFTNEAIVALPIKDPRALDRRYLMYFLANADFGGAGANRAVMGQTLNKKSLALIDVPVPPLDEQRRIAAILDKADAIRRKRREAIALTEELLRSTFLEMFGDPVTNPKGWPVQPMGDAIRSARYGPRFHNEPYVDDGIRIVRITDLDGFGRLDFEAMPMHDLGAEVVEKFALEAGDVIFARTGATVGKTALISEGAPPCIAGAYFIQLRFVDSVLPTFAQAFFSSDSIQRIIANTSRQSAQQNFSGPAIRRLRLPMPPTSLQAEFETARLEILLSVQKQTGALEQSDDLFNSLVQRAFRGDL